MNEQNIAIAAQDAQKISNRSTPDPVRLQRDQERREKYGELRAREHPGKRPKQAHSIFPYIDLSKD
jgi:hypothetical protein